MDQVSEVYIILNLVIPPFGLKALLPISEAIYNPSITIKASPFDLN